jgi:hypothetical protein
VLLFIVPCDRLTVKSGLLILIVVMLVGAGYSLSSTFLFVQGAIVGGVSCSPQGNGKTYCCASVYDPSIPSDANAPTTYCTTCDDTNPPSNCTPREKPKAVVNPGRDLSNILEGSVLEGATTGQRANISILPGGILQAENNFTFSQKDISSNNDNNDTLALDQSDQDSDTVKKPTRTVDDEEGQDESQTTEEPSDEPVDQVKND